MNSLLRGLSLNLLLRNFFAGVFFMGSLYRGGLFQNIGLTASEGIAAGAFMALVMGSLVYGIPRYTTKFEGGNG